MTAASSRGVLAGGDPDEDGRRHYLDAERQNKKHQAECQRQDHGTSTGRLLRPRRITRPVGDDGFDGAGHSYKVPGPFLAVEATCLPALVHGRDE